jgi:hypothetical protein
MYSAEYDSFKQALTDLCIAVNRPYSDDLVRVFWEDLRDFRLGEIQTQAAKVRSEGKTKFTSADLRPMQAKPFAGTFEPVSSNLDHFDRFGNIQFLKFLRLYDTTPAQLPVLLQRKRDIIDAARNDPEMQLSEDEDKRREQGAELHEILFGAWRKVIGAEEIKPKAKPDGFDRIGAVA